MDIQQLVDAADEVLTDREVIKTPAEARLALLIHSIDPSRVHSRETCSCDDPENCDECPPTEAGVIDALKALAIRDQRNDDHSEKPKPETSPELKS